MTNQEDYFRIKDSREDISNISDFLSQISEKDNDLELWKDFIFEPVSTNETSLERIEKKIDQLTKEVATKDDLLDQTNQLITSQTKLNDELLEKLGTLRELQKNNVVHKRLLRYSASFFSFFAFSFLLKEFFIITVVTPIWNSIGLFVSFGFILMAWSMKFVWKKDILNGGKGE